MKNLNSLVLVFGVIVLSACGSQTSSLSTSSAAGTGTQTGVATVVTSGSNNAAAIQRRVEMSGQSGADPTASFTVSTSSMLKVKITPLSAPNLTIPGYTNWVFPYACLQVTVSVNGITQTTQVLKVAGMNSSQCQDAPTSQILDFGSASSGNGNTVVTIQNAAYDNCRYNWSMYYGCYMSQIWQNHRVALNAQVQVDGTSMSP